MKTPFSYLWYFFIFIFILSFFSLSSIFNYFFLFLSFPHLLVEGRDRPSSFGDCQSLAFWLQCWSSWIFAYSSPSCGCLLPVFDTTKIVFLQAASNKQKLFWATLSPLTCEPSWRHEHVPQPTLDTKCLDSVFRRREGRRKSKNMKKKGYLKERKTCRLTAQVRGEHSWQAHKKNDKDMEQNVDLGKKQGALLLTSFSHLFALFFCLRRWFERLSESAFFFCFSLWASGVLITSWSERANRRGQHVKKKGGKDRKKAENEKWGNSKKKKRRGASCGPRGVRRRLHTLPSAFATLNFFV